MALWTLHGDGKSVPANKIVLPEERLSWPRTIGFGMQHVVAMFGATFLVPVITGFPPSTTLLFSGLGTILFLLITKNQLPSYLGSSFAFLAPIGVAVGSTGSRGVALGGIIIVGVTLALVGLIVHFSGTRWIAALMPPVVAGTIVALIGLNLAPAAWGNVQAAPLTALVTLLAVVLATVLFKGMLGRLSILIGVVVGYLFALTQGEVDFTAVAQAAPIGLPEFTAPIFDGQYLMIYLGFLPVVLALVAENVSHVKGVGALIDRDLDKLTGRALLSDGLATTLAGSFGGSATTTYGENIGVMASTRVFSTAAYWVAAITAILLSLSPAVGVFLATIPQGVIGGVATALYGLIGVIGFRMWIDAKVDFSQPKNQFTAAVGLIVAIGGFVWADGSGQEIFSGIVLATMATLVVYHLMNLVGRLRKTDEA